MHSDNQSFVTTIGVSRQLSEYSRVLRQRMICAPTINRLYRSESSTVGTQPCVPTADDLCFDNQSFVSTIGVSLQLSEHSCVFRQLMIRAPRQSLVSRRLWQVQVTVQDMYTTSFLLKLVPVADDLCCDNQSFTTTIGVSLQLSEYSRVLRQLPTCAPTINHLLPLSEKVFNCRNTAVCSDS